MIPICTGDFTSSYDDGWPVDHQPRVTRSYPDTVFASNWPQKFL